MTRVRSPRACAVVDQRSASGQQVVARRVGRAARSSPGARVADAPSCTRPKFRSTVAQSVGEHQGRPGAAPASASTASTVGSSPSSPRSARSSRSSGPPTTVGCARRLHRGRATPSTSKISTAGYSLCQPPLTSDRARVVLRGGPRRRPRGRSVATRRSPGEPSSAWCTSTGSGTSAELGQVVADDEVADAGPTEVRRQPGRPAALREPLLDGVEHPDVAGRGERDGVAHRPAAAAPGTAGARRAGSPTRSCRSVEPGTSRAVAVVGPARRASRRSRVQ